MKRISFIGDSLTEGLTSIQDKKLDQASKDGYLTNGARMGYMGFPYKVSQLLKKDNQTAGYEVLNFGFGSRIIREFPQLSDEDDNGVPLSYWRTCDFRKAIESKADIYVVMFGTNDILYDANVSNKTDQMKAAYESFLKTLLGMENHPQVYFMIPPAVNWQKYSGKKRDPKLFTQWLPSVIRDVGLSLKHEKLQIIDLQKNFNEEMSEKFLPDGVHPNQNGFDIIANTIYQEIFKKK